MASNYGMVLNLDRCIGCYACVVACKMCYGTRPGVNYNAVETFEWGEYPDVKQRFMLTMCNHCETPPCTEVCPVGATTKTDEGPVIVDYDMCIGCGACVEACPYGERHLVVDDETSFEGDVAPYEEESSARLNVTEKCTFCYHRVQEGMQPMCATMCPGQCRIFGDLNDPESDISLYIEDKGAIQIEGTSMYYVVPEGMDTSLLPLGLVQAMAAHNVNEPEETASETTAGTAAESTAGSIAETEAATEAAAAPQDNGISPGTIAVGVAGVAAAAVIGSTIYRKGRNEPDTGENSDK